MSADQAARMIELLQLVHSDMSLLLGCLGFSAGTLFWLFSFYVVFCWRSR